MELLLLAGVLSYDPNDEQSSSAAERCVQRYLVDLRYKQGLKTDKKVFTREDPRLSALRGAYLSILAANYALPVEQRRPVVFLDESYIHEHYKRHTQTLYDPNDPLDKQQRIKFKGSRLCIIAAIIDDYPHTMTAAQIVPNSVHIFSPQRKVSDYHGNFNAAYFEAWVKEKLIPNLPSRCLVVMDNAKYHIIRNPAAPEVSKMRKAELQGYLKKHNVPFLLTDFRPHLMSLAKAHSAAHYKDQISTLLADAGHVLAFQPPLHSDLNAIEMLWAYVKGVVARQYDVKRAFAEMHQQLLAAFDEAQTNYSLIRSLFQHTRKVERQYQSIDDADAAEEPVMILSKHQRERNAFDVANARAAGAIDDSDSDASDVEVEEDE